jgi:hypothetical protein
MVVATRYAQKPARLGVKGVFHLGTFEPKIAKTLNSTTVSEVKC